MLSRHAKSQLLMALFALGATGTRTSSPERMFQDPEIQKIKNSKAQKKRERRMARNKALLEKNQ